MRLSGMQAIIATLLVAAAASSAAQVGKSGVLVMVLPTPPGTPYDVTARKIQPEIAAALKQPVIVENLGGGSGSIAAQKLLQKDGAKKVLFASAQELVMAPLLIPGVRYKPTDFRLVAKTGDAPLNVFARPGLPANDMRELFALAKRPGTAPLSYGSSGNGSLFHLVGAGFAKRLGTEMTHIPYRGGAAAVQDLVGNQLDLAFLPMTPGYQQMVKAGQLKHFAVLTRDRQQAFAGIPAIAEFEGFKDFNFSIWGGFFVTADTPEAEATELGGTIYNVVTSPAFVQWHGEQGISPAVRATPNESAAFWAEETKRYLDLSKGLGSSVQR